MGWTYSCPECRAILSPDSSIILCGSHDGRRILIGFHPEPGNYEINVPPDTAIEPGERWEFYCPVCGASLVSGEDENLCVLDQQKGDHRRQVLFSRIAGEHVTFVLAGQKVEETHGEHADHYAPRLMKKRFLL
jgi:hypothetical protein